MTAVVPGLPVAKQWTEVSVKLLKGPVHLLKNRRIHLPAPISRSSYHINRRCNTRSPQL